MNIEINDEKQLVNMMVEGAKALIMKEDIFPHLFVYITRS